MLYVSKLMTFYQKIVYLQCVLVNVIQTITTRTYLYYVYTKKPLEKYN